MLTAIGLTPGGSSTAHIYTKNNTEEETINNFGWKAFWDANRSGQTKMNDELTTYGPCPVFASYTLALALQLRKSTEKKF